MFSDDSTLSLTRDGSGAVLIDRDGEYFQPLLNYLRHGQLVINPNLNPLGVYEEARFFGLDEVADSLLGEVEPPSQRRELPVLLCAQEGAHVDGVKSLLALEDGTLVSGGVDGLIVIWRPVAGPGGGGTRLVRSQEYRGHQRDVNALVLEPTTGQLFSASHDHTVKLWDAPAAAMPLADDALPPAGCRASLRSHAAEVSCLGSRNGWIVSGSYDKSLCFWPWGAQDAQPASRAHKNAHDGAVLALCMCGDLVVSCALDSTMAIWGVETEVLLATFSTHAPIAYSLVATPPPARRVQADAIGTLYSGDVNNLVKQWMLWRSPEGRVRVDPVCCLTGHDDVVFAMSADGDRLLTASSDASVGVWHTRAGQPELLGQLAHGDKVYSVASCGAWLFSGGKNGEIRVYRWDGDASAAP